ncbi:uncharacterized protein [Centruroides vittatus]|uniref:uncharacterized protein isoform X2 n=1 Tax=Centruroides vittatus TaxID=120091 RepID=UPI0035103514
MADITEPVLVAVLYKNSITNQRDEDHSSIIGTILIHDRSVKLEKLRSELKRLVPALPSEFQFVTKESWPIADIYESEIKASQIIGIDNILRICRKFDLPPVGIKLQERSIGFVFVNLNSTLQQIREIIQSELHNSLPDSFIYINQQKQWPVSKEQECKLIGWDILYHEHFMLSSNAKSFRALCKDSSENIKRKKCKTNSERDKLMEMSVAERRNSLPNLNFYQNKKILISYVRAEASKHARDLKRELADLGFNVFLDIDEIQAGNDWQDKLNDAVGSCEIFVPLITPQYGLTRWTNREIKLADVMEKVIIPINFLDHWPPDCLSIQFCALQYIPWKTLGEFERAKIYGEEDRGKDIRFWDQPFVRRAAKSIELSYKSFTKEPDLYAPLVRNPSLRSYPSPISEEYSIINKPKDGVPLIVISVHPDQKSIGNDLRNKLQNKNVEVWCSTDDLDKDYDSCSSISSSPVTPTASLHFVGRSHSPAYNSSQSDNTSELGRKSSFQFSNHFENGINFSQITNSQSSTMPISTLNKLKVFKKKSDEASLVIILLSQAYCSSKTSIKQVYYCEHRKWTIVIKTEEFNMPNWITHLLDVKIIEYLKEESLKNIQNEVKKALESNILLNFKSEDKKIQRMAKQLLLKMNGHISVYVTGNTKFYNAKTENICHAIGQELATLKFLTLVTGGFYGVCEAVGRSFCEDREVIGEKPGRVFHILPKHDDKDFSLKGRQNVDGTFQKVPYGQTFFIGDSMQERVSVVASVFDICIVIEGGPRVANEIQEFVWNDQIVIPVISTGGAASGKFGISKRILEVPPGVNEEDWLILAKQDITADDVGRAVKRIVCSLVKNRSSGVKHNSKNKNEKIVKNKNERIVKNKNR